MQQIGVVDGAIGGTSRVAALAALFPRVSVASVGPIWPDYIPGNIDILIVPADTASLDAVVMRLKEARSPTQIVVVLEDADVRSTRRLVHEGAADVLPAPVSEPALALCLERLLGKVDPERNDTRKTGEVVAVLKAGGGVGATALTVHVATALSSRGNGAVCIADLDLQFGVAGLYLDLPEAITITDVLGAGSAIADTAFSSLLATHKSGVRVLAGPRELMPLESVTASQVDGLLKGLRRDFALTLVDLPSVWTAWTYRVLSQVDRIVLVTHLSVPHVQLMRRQLKVLTTQKLDSRPLTLVCNSVSPDQQTSVSIKAAERTLGRAFDAVIPEDQRTMIAAINQGLELSVVRRGTKLEKAITELAGKIAGGVAAAAPTRPRW